MVTISLTDLFFITIYSWKNHIITYHESAKFSQIFQFGVYLLHNIVLVSAVQLSESATSIHTSPSSWISLPLPHPIHLGPHRAASWGSCAIHQLPTSCFTHGSIYVYPILPVHPPFPTPVSTHLFSTSSFLPADRFICTIALYSTHMH